MPGPSPALGDPPVYGPPEQNGTLEQGDSPGLDAGVGGLEASKLVGTKVKNEGGKDIGEIDQLIIDSSTGKVSHVVIGRGGVAGVGEQKVVVGWSDIKLQADPNNRRRMTAMVDQSKLDTAQRYEARRDRDMTPAASPGTPRPAASRARTRSNDPTRSGGAHARRGHRPFGPR